MSLTQAVATVVQAVATVVLVVVTIWYVRLTKHLAETAEKAHSNAEKIFEESVKGRLDALAGIVTIEMMTNPAFNPMYSSGAVSLDLDQFKSAEYRLYVRFRATNHGSMPTYVRLPNAPAGEWLVPLRSMLLSASGGPSDHWDFEWSMTANGGEWLENPSSVEGDFELRVTSQSTAAPVVDVHTWSAAVTINQPALGVITPASVIQMGTTSQYWDSKRDYFPA
jgi:hypothetical protein